MFEKINNIPESEQMDRSDEAMQAAAELIAENEILATNPQVQRLLENDFVTEAGNELDPGNFMVSMLDFLERKNKDEESLTTEQVAERVRQLEAEVVHSLPPTIEGQREKY